MSVTLLLYIGSIAFRTLGLSDQAEALGLPEGSIRALIAMTLILMFAIIGVAVFQAGEGSSASTPFVSTGVPEDQLDRFTGSEVLEMVRVSPAPDTTGSDTFNVKTRAKMPEASHDFGLQLLSTVSTLVVAVAGFYFGSRAVTAAAAATKPDTSASMRVVSPGSKATLTRDGDIWAPVDIVLEVSPAYVDVQTNIDGDSEGRIDRTDTGKYRYSPGSDPGAVVLATFKMADPYSATATVAFTKPA